MCYVIGIAGPSAGGKTTVTSEIIKSLTPKYSYVVIGHDNYYKDQSDLSMEERVKANYDHPNSFDTPMLIEHIKDLLNQKSIDQPVYNYAEHTRDLNKVVKVEPTDLIIVEGILALENDELNELFNLKIYVDTDADECIIRRIRRDTVSRGRTIDSVINQYLETVKPMFLEFIEPTKRKADVIIPYSRNNHIAIKMVSDHIKRTIKSN